MNNKYFRPTIHLYIRSRIETSFIKVEPDEWINAIALPVAQWKNSSAQQVYADSRRIIT